MAEGIFIAAYKREDLASGLPDPAQRLCAIFRYSDLIAAAGGRLEQPVEVLGDRAICKVRNAPDSLLATIAADPHIRRLPLDLLGESLNGLSDEQRDELRDELRGGWEPEADGVTMVWNPTGGYPLGQIIAALGNSLRDRTLRQAMEFLATRKRKPRFTGTPSAGPGRRNTAGDGVTHMDGPETPTIGVRGLD